MTAGRDDYKHHSLIFTVKPLGDYTLIHELYSVSSVLYAPVSENPTPQATPELIELKIPTPKVIDNPDPMGSHDKLFAVVGSCNGLVCIFSFFSRKFFLWNPCLKKSKRLPRSGMEVRFASSKIFLNSTKVGFGYDELNDDYKLVGLFQFSGEAALMMKVYSLKNDSWTDSKAAVPRDVWRWWGNLQFLSGKLHWLIDGGRIGSLNLTNEMYDEMDSPNPNHMFHKSGMVVLGGCLSVSYDFGTTQADIWVMKEYGVKESWTKLVSIPYVPLFVSDGVGSKCRTQPVWLLRSGEILYVFGTELVLYNPKKMNTFRWFPGKYQIENVIMYFETLVSPH